MKNIITIFFLLCTLPILAGKKDITATFVVCPIETKSCQAKASIMPTADIDSKSPLLNGTFYSYPSLVNNTSIRDVEDSQKQSVKTIYNLQGVKLKTTTKGVNIIKCADGSTKKITK